MSFAPASTNKGPANSAANRNAAAQKAANGGTANPNNNKVPGVGPGQSGGSGFGGGRISYDAKGNVLVDGKIQTNSTGQPNFSSVNAGDRFFAERGFSNNGFLVNSDVAAAADWNVLPSYYEPRGNPEYENAKLRARNESPSLVLENGSIVQKNPNRLNPVVSLGANENSGFIITKSKEVQSPKSDFVTVKPSSEPLFGSSPPSHIVYGKNQPSNKNPPPQQDYGYAWASGKTGTQFSRNSILEDQVKQQQADSAAAAFGVSKYDNADYVTGGTLPPRSQGGPETPQSKQLESETNYGWGVGQNIRNSAAESALMVSEAKKGLAKESGENVSFTTFKPTDRNPNAEPLRPQVKAAPFSALSPTGDVFPAKELAFNDFVNTNAAKGATFDILVNNKTVGEVKGPNSLSSIMAYEKAHPDQSISVSTSYPERESEFLSALKSNPDKYSSLPQSYWDKLSSQGFIGQTNIKQVNSILQSQNTVENITSVGKYQRDVSTTLAIENEEGAVSSLFRAPFSGTKISTPWGNYTLPGGSKAQTSIIPSTSMLTPLADFWFKPYDILGLAVVKAADKIDPFLGKLGFKVKQKVNTGLQNQVLYNDITKLNNAPKNIKELKITAEPQVRQRPTYRSTNPTRTSLPSDIIKYDNAKGDLGSANQFVTPKHLENVGPERTSNANKIMNDLLNPKPSSQPTNPPASPNIFNNFFKGQTTAKGKAYAGNKAALDLIVSMNKNEEANVQSKASGISPIIRPTEPNTQLSPTSRQFFGEQFKGVYPESYLPPSSAFGPEVIKPEVYSNVGGGIFDASTFRNNARTNYKEFEIKQRAAKVAESEKNFGFLIKEKPLVPIRVKNAIGQFYKATNPEDFFAENKAGRASRVENSFIGEYSEVFSNKGVKYTNERGDVFFVERGTPKGALGKTPTEPSVITRLARPTPSNELVFKGYYYKGTSPTYFSVFKYSQETDVKNLFGFGEQKVASGKTYAGKSPLEKYNLIAEQGQREGDIVGINAETGTFKRIFYTKPQSTGRSAPSDILTGFNQFGRTIFKNAKGGNYYLAGQVKSTGPKILRGELSEKHDIANIRFSKWLEKNPQQEPIGAKGVWADLEKSLPKNFGKAATFSTSFRETNKGFKGKSTSGSEFFKTKPPEKAPKGTEFFNKGSKSETVLIKKPLVKKNLVTDTKTEYEYQSLATPPESKNGVLSSLSISGILSNGLKIGPKGLSKQISRQSEKSKLWTPTKAKEVPSILSNTKVRTTPKQKPGLSQMPRILQTPKTNQTPKQGSKQSPKVPTPLIPRTNQTQSPVPRIPRPDFGMPIFQYPPPRKPPADIMGGFKIRNKNYNTKQGPSALEELGIKNIFTSSFDIKVTKANRFEF